MLLTCPACDTQYKVDDADLAPGGSRVRCFRCSYTWTVTPPATPSATPPVGGSAPGLEPESGSESGPEAEAMPEPVSDPVHDPGSEPAPESEESEAEGSVGDIRESFSTASAQNAARPMFPLYLLILILAIALGSLMWSKRERLATAHPLLTQAYALVGYEAVQAGEGLSLSAFRSLRRGTGASAELLVEGEVANNSAQPRSLPALRILLFDGSGREVAAWTERLAEENLQPGERAFFSISRPNPPADAVDATIEFVPIPAE